MLGTRAADAQSLTVQATVERHSTTLTVPLQEPTPEQLADAHSKVSKLGDTNTDFFEKVVAVNSAMAQEEGGRSAASPP